MPIKTLGSLGKIRVSRVTGNTLLFWPQTNFMIHILRLYMIHISRPCMMHVSRLYMIHVLRQYMVYLNIKAMHTKRFLIYKCFMKLVK